LTQVDRSEFCLSRRAVLRGAAAAVAAAALPAPAQGAWPSRPVRIVVPFAAGGGSDAIARFTASRLNAALKQPFVVDNRPGAGGNLGTEQGLHSAPDGYTLTLIASSYSVNAAVYNLGFDPVADMTPIVQISNGPLLIVANPKTNIKTIGDLIQKAKTNPDKINYATSGAGGVAHAATELFMDRVGIRMTHIPYKGAAPAMSDTLAGTCDVYFSSVAIALPHIRAGKLVAVAVTTPTRLNALPNVPTVAESGIPGFDVPHWHGLIGPKGLSQEVVAKVNSAVNAFLKAPDANEHLQRDGVSAAGGTPSLLQERIAREVAGWKKLAAKGRLKVD
jgi:tripartite-type tricarboxylate transporter receptor subunit TctC